MFSGPRKAKDEIKRRDVTVVWQISLQGGGSGNQELGQHLSRLSHELYPHQTPTPILYLSDQINEIFVSLSPGANMLHSKTNASSIKVMSALTGGHGINRLWNFPAVPRVRTSPR